MSQQTVLAFGDCVEKDSTLQGKQRAEALRAKYWGETELADEELSVVAGGADKSQTQCGNVVNEESCPALPPGQN
jgi:hypothetical protein